MTAIRSHTTETSDGGVERRSGGAIEVRAVQNGGRTLVGYAALFNELSSDLGGFRELIQPGAFGSSLSGDVRALWNHDERYVLGRTVSGSLRLAEDDLGLRVEIDPPDAHWAHDAMVSIGRGDVSQMSFAFTVRADEWVNLSGETIRILKDVKLLDVSPVTYPAYPQTTIAVRQHAEALRAQSLSDNQHLSGEPETAGAADWQVDMMRRRLQLMEVA